MLGVRSRRWFAVVGRVCMPFSVSFAVAGTMGIPVAGTMFEIFQSASGVFFAGAAGKKDCTK